MKIPSAHSQRPILSMVKYKFLVSVPCNLSTEVSKIFGQFYCLEIMESERRLAVDNGFNAAIQEIS